MALGWEIPVSSATARTSQEVSGSQSGVRAVGAAKQDRDTPWTPRVGDYVWVTVSCDRGQVVRIEGHGEDARFVLTIYPRADRRVYTLTELSPVPVRHHP